MPQIPESTDSIAALYMLAASCGLLAVACAFLFLTNPIRKLLNKQPYSFQRKAIIPVILLILSVLVNRYAVARFDVTGELVKLESWWLELFNSVLHTFQTFSLDEDYTLYLRAGKLLVRSLTDSAFYESLYAIVSSVQNLACAATSATVIISVLSKLFPRLKLWHKSFIPFKPVYYFSAINPEALALARSLTKRKGFFQPVIIFCDASTNSEEDTKSELIEQANQLGAVCLKDDLPALRLMRRKGKTFFLIDSEAENLQALSAFAGSRQASRLSDKDFIYLFSESDASAPMVRMVEQSLMSELDKHKKHTPSIFTINKHQSLIYELLKNKPLFSAMKPEDRDMHIVILGAGRTGMEMFLAAYWCGQTLRHVEGDGEEVRFQDRAVNWPVRDFVPRKLRLSVISKEPPEDFFDRLNHINPEILLTSRLINYTGKGNNEENEETRKKLLKIYSDHEDKQFAETYCDLEYIQQDVCKDSFIDRFRKHDCGSLVNADYFAVTLGSDLTNIEVAENLSRYIRLYADPDLHIAGAKVPIACAIFDGTLSQLIKSRNESGKSTAPSSEQVPPDTLSGARNPARMAGFEIVPFASLGTTYDHSRLLLSEMKTNVEHLSDSYGELVNKRKSKSDDYRKDVYGYWANVARAIHTRYKAFSLGYSDDEKTTAYDKYKSAVVTGLLPGTSKTGSSTEMTRHMLAWLEHRRWNAFMRTRGFRCPTEEEEKRYLSALPDVADKNDTETNRGKHKSLELRLHPCIVECDWLGKSSGDGSRPMDMLDDAAKRLTTGPFESKNLQVSAFKEYDYPEYDFPSETVNDASGCFTALKGLLKQKHKDRAADEKERSSDESNKAAAPDDSPEHCNRQTDHHEQGSDTASRIGTKKRSKKQKKKK